MLSLIKSDLFHRFAGGFALGAVAMIALQSPENASQLVMAIKGAAGLLA